MHNGGQVAIFLCLDFEKLLSYFYKASLSPRIKMNIFKSSHYALHSAHVAVEDLGSILTVISLHLDQEQFSQERQKIRTQELKEEYCSCAFENEQMYFGE